MAYSDLTIEQQQQLDELAERIAQYCVENDPNYPIDRCGQCQYFVSSPSDLPVGACARHADRVLEQDVACLNFQTVGG